MSLRRSTSLFGAAVLWLAASSAFAAAEPLDPVATVTAIYQQVLQQGEGRSGGQFLWVEPVDRRKWMTASLVALWARADRRTPGGDQGPIAFDPVTNSQDPCIKDARITLEPTAKGAPKSKARVAAAMTGCRGSRAFPGDDIVFYEMRREARQWRIDDIRGTGDGQPWSVRAMLAAP
jgi:hypothetical protein